MYLSTKKENINKIPNPIKTINWKGHADDGFWVVYDKETETTSDYEIENLILIKKGYVVSGYDIDEEASYFSNEVDNIFEHNFKIRKKIKGIKEKQLVAEGKYSKGGVIKDLNGTNINLKKGISLCVRITAYDIKNDKIIGLNIKGKSYFELEELIKVLDPTKNYIKYIGKIDDSFELGSSKRKQCYTRPGFEIGEEINEQDLKIAKECEKEVIEYFGQYENKKKEDKEAEIDISKTGWKSIPDEPRTSITGVPF